MDLFAKGAFDNCQKVIDSLAPNGNLWVILDPPRSGLKELDNWVTKLKARYVTYLSCNPSTQVRDTLPFSSSLEFVELYDFFPGTHHLEGLCHFELK